MIYEIAETTVTDKLEELLPLLFDHRNELATYPALMEVNPDMDKYRALETTGAMFSIVARCDGAIVGYSINLITHAMHYKHLKFVMNDVLYVDRAHRKTQLGLKLMHATEAKARVVGAQMMTWHAKTHTALASILPRMDYVVQDITFSKEL